MHVDHMAGRIIGKLNAGLPVTVHENVVKAPSRAEEGRGHVVVSAQRRDFKELVFAQAFIDDFSLGESPAEIVREEPQIVDRIG